MYSSHIAEDQANARSLVRAEADSVFDALNDAEAFLSGLNNRINYGPDLNENGQLVLNRLHAAAKLLDVILDLYGEAYEVIHAD